MSFLYCSADGGGNLEGESHIRRPFSAFFWLFVTKIVTPAAGLSLGFSLDGGNADATPWRKDLTLFAAERPWVRGRGRPVVS